MSGFVALLAALGGCYRRSWGRPPHPPANPSNIDVRFRVRESRG